MGKWSFLGVDKDVMFLQITIWDTSCAYTGKRTCSHNVPTCNEGEGEGQQANEEEEQIAGKQFERTILDSCSTYIYKGLMWSLNRIF